MALGNLAERNELTAMKASGMSFLRILQPLVFMILLCGGALVQQHRLARSQHEVRALLHL